MHLDGAVDPNTGGVQLFVEPGVRVGWKSGLSWFASAGLPVLQNLDGEQAETRFRVAAGVQPVVLMPRRGRARVRCDLAAGQPIECAPATAMRPRVRAESFATSRRRGS